MISWLTQWDNTHPTCTHTHTHSVLHQAAQRQDLVTVACLIRLGADPLLKNTFNSSTTDMLALKHFPPKNFTLKLEEKGETTNNVLLYYILASLVTEISACVCTGQLLCLGAHAHAQARYTVVCLCVCRLLQLLKDQRSASKSF